MTYASATADDFTFGDPHRSCWRFSLRRLLGVTVVVLSGLAGAMLLQSHVADPLFGPSHAAKPARVAEAAANVAREASLAPNAGAVHEDGVMHEASMAHEAPAMPRVGLAAGAYNPLFDPGFSLGAPPLALTLSAPLSAAFVASLPQPQPDQIAAASPPPVVPAPPAPAEAIASLSPPSVVPALDAPVVEGTSPPLPPAAPAVAMVEPSSAPVADVPVPAPRPPEIGARSDSQPMRLPQRRFTQQARAVEAPAPTPDNRSFIEKLFGIQRPPGPVLAYAAPEDGEIAPAPGSAPRSSLGYDRFTAVYDIAAHTVYLPDGTRLEAHSGLGSRLDDPRHVAERNVGPTPPSVYELTPREALFHGVRALRLTPVGGGSVYGRSGLLAHSYMLGPNGDSNGCVSFRNYNAFLQAYLSGQVKRLVVVPHLS